MAFTFRWVPTPGQDNNFVNGSINGGRARAFLDDGKVDPFDSPLYICIPPIGFFEGGNASADSLYDFARTIATCAQTLTVQQPAVAFNGKRIGGGALTINGNPCGNYEFNILPGGTTLQQVNIPNLFSTANDLSSWIVCKGNLTVGSNVTLIPTVTSGYTRNDPTSTEPDANALRRLFMVIYVTGNLTFGIDSLISMSACGGNSSSTGANIASFQVPVANNLTGGGSIAIAAAGTTPTAPDPTTVAGIAGPGGSVILDGSVEIFSTAGGGSGYMVGTFGALIPPGSGGAGSPFSGGTGGGNTSRGLSGATSGSSLGGAGGNTAPGSSGTGGTGNPGGTGTYSSLSGTGGVLIIIVGGSIITPNLGKVAANGVKSGPTNPGGASGGGIILQLSGNGTYCNNIFAIGGARVGDSGSGGDGCSGAITL